MMIFLFRVGIYSSLNGRIDMQYDLTPTDGVLNHSITLVLSAALH